MRKLLPLQLCLLVSFIFRSITLLAVCASTSKNDFKSRVSSSDSWRQSALDELKFWLLRNGASFPKLEVAVVANTLQNGSRVAGADACGTYAIDDIALGEVIIHMPDKLLLTSSTATLSEPLVRNLTLGKSSGKLHDKHTFSSHAIMAVALLEKRQRGSKSFFAPYIATLPRSLDHLPLFYTHAEHYFLRGTGFLSSIKINKKAVLQQWQNILNTMPSFAERYTQDDFMWAYGNVASRAFTKSLKSEKSSQMYVLSFSNKIVVSVADT